MGSGEVRRRSGPIRWTLLMVLVGLLLAAGALAGIASDQQVCFSDRSVPCPTGEDPRVGWLTFAFFGIPAIWLAGLAAIAVRGRRATGEGR